MNHEPRLFDHFGAAPTKFLSSYFDFAPAGVDAEDAQDFGAIACYAQGRELGAAAAIVHRPDHNDLMANGTVEATQLRRRFPDILSEEVDREQYLANCEGLARNIEIVFRPQSEASLVEFVVDCAHAGRPFYVISQGRNWGYGSALPVKNGCALIDLSALNDISGYDPEVGTINLQPGVTQQQAADFLAERESPWMIPTTGAGPGSSILGNALERGFGLNAICDHFLSVISMRVLLADGRIIESRLKEIGAWKSDSVSKWKVGPYLDGLFSQSNLGVVLSMKVELAPRPESVQILVIKASRTELKSLVTLTQELRRKYGPLIGMINFSNRTRLEFTTDSTYGDAKKSWIRRFIRRLSGAEFKDWQAVIPLSAGTREMKYIYKRVVKDCRDQGLETVLLSERRCRRLLSLSWLLKRLSLSDLQSRLHDVLELIKMAKGIPSGFGLKAVYREALDVDHAKLNPAQDKVGLLWFSPILRFKWGDFERIIGVFERVLSAHGQPSLLTIVNFDFKLCEATIPVLFQQGDALAQRRADECWSALFANCLAEGFAPYRYPIHHMNLTQPTRGACVEISRDLKRVFDPSGVVSPGRYI